MSQKGFIVEMNKPYEFTSIDLTEAQLEPTNNDVTEQPIESNSETAIPDAPKAEIEKPAETEIKKETEADALPMTSKEMAKFTVGLINIGLVAGVPALQLKSEFTESEILIIEAIQAGQEVDENSNTVASVQRRYIQFIKKCESIPLSDDEQKSYAKAWEKCFDKWNIKMTPETALITSTLVIVGSRFMPIVGNKLQQLFSR